MLFKKYIRKQIIKILCDIGTHTEARASEFTNDYLKNDKYQNNSYRGPFAAYIDATNWMSNEILKRL